MGERQLGFAEAFVDPRMLSAGKLAGLSQVIDWQPIDALAEALREKDVGRPPYAGAAMQRALYLQALYDLSDPGLEEALLVRLDFRLFCGFSLSERTPDETTICRFRNAAAAAGLIEAAFVEVNRQLEAKGLMVKKGTLIDATLVSAASRRPQHERGSKPKLAREPEASFTRKGGKSYFGWRLHIAVDQGSGLVRRARVTPAHVNESSVADGLVCGDEKAVYADRGYESKARRKALKARGIKDRIMHRSHKHQSALPHWQAVRNRLISRRRAAVEGVFGTLKRTYARGRSHFFGLDKTAADLMRTLTVYNLRRALTLCCA
jgi:transposase, IS5 family